MAKEKWVSVASPHFTVLTTASESIARSWATELERFRLMLGQVVNVPEERLRPVTVVLFSSDRALRPFKPVVKGKPQELAGLFVNFGDSHAIELSLEGDREEVRRVIFHEVVHWYSSAGDRVLPVWLEEGVAEVYSTFKVEPDGKCAFGNVVPEHLQLFADRPRFEIEKLVTTSRDSLDYNEGARVSRFYAGAWLATHYLLFGEDTPGRASVARYLEASEHAPTLEAAFQGAFGSTYREFGERLRAYLNQGSYHIYHYRSPAAEIEKTLQSRPATDAEVELALGTLLLGARLQRTPEADARLARAAALAPENPVIWQVLGEGAMLEKQYDDAERYFNKAVAAGSDSYLSHYTLGYCRTRGMDQSFGMADPGEILQSMRDFRRAIQLNPRFVPAYESLGGLMFALENPPAGDRALLEQGARLAPDSPLIGIGLAACDLHAGRREDGRRRLNLLLQDEAKLPPEVRGLARNILHGDDWNEFSRKLQGLFDGKHYADAVALIDSTHGQFDEPRFRESLKQGRRQARDYARIQEAVASANRGESTAAVHLLREVLDSDGDNTSKREAQRLLRLIAPAEAR